MSDQKDPTKWIAIVLSAVSLIVAGTLAYNQLIPRHDFHAIIASLPYENRAVTVNILLVNKGNQVETFIVAAALDDKKCAVAASSQPALVSPGAAAVVHFKVPEPTQGFNGKPYSVAYEIADSSAKTFPILFSVLNDAFTINRLPKGAKYPELTWNPASQDLFSPAPNRPIPCPQNT